MSFFPGKSAGFFFLQAAAARSPLRPRGGAREAPEQRLEAVHLVRLREGHVPAARGTCLPGAAPTQGALEELRKAIKAFVQNLVQKRVLLAHF